MTILSKRSVCCLYWYRIEENNSIIDGKKAGQAEHHDTHAQKECHPPKPGGSPKPMELGIPFMWEVPWECLTERE